MTTDSALERIKKLLAHADSARSLGSAAEAEAFAAKAAEIALQHKLDLDTVDLDAGIDEDPIDREDVNTAILKGDRPTRNRSAWQQGLISALARYNGVRIVVYPGSKQVALVGRASDREIVKYLYLVLARAGERMARRQGHVKRDFLLGYVAGIREALAERWNATIRAAGDKGTALVRKQDHAVGRALRQHFPRLCSTGRMTSARAGASYEAGRQAGRGANLNSGVGSGSAPGPRQLSA